MRLIKFDGLLSRGNPAKPVGIYDPSCLQPGEVEQNVTHE